MTIEFEGLLRRLRMAEKRQSETLADTRKQIDAIQKAISNELQEKLPLGEKKK